MRDYRDAKAMAQTLRQTLKAQSIDITHSNALELIAKSFGVRNWQVLLNEIEGAPATPGPTEPPAQPQSTALVLRCSFCEKTQHEVLKLIAGPHVFICDECVGLCDDIVSGAQDLRSGNRSLDLTALEARANARITHTRQLLDLIAAADGQRQSAGVDDR